MAVFKHCASPYPLNIDTPLAQIDLGFPMRYGLRENDIPGAIITTMNAAAN